MSLKVVIAPTAFKGTASPRQVARQLAAGWRRRRRGDHLTLMPVADGGDGTAEVLRQALGGRVLSRKVAGPLGDPVTAKALLTPDGDAVVEMASASGLTLVPEHRRDPARADTRGTGQLVAACLDAGAQRVLVGLGGSATIDGGAGFAHELGVRFLDGSGQLLDPNPRALEQLKAVDLRHLHPRATCIEGLSDVTNPLLGRNGAAAVYGPQKGARPDDIRLIDRVLRQLVGAVDAAATSSRGTAARSIPGAGAAGGLGFGIVALAGGRLMPGAQRVADLVGLTDALAGADLAVTGEGKLDAQTLQGKAPAMVAAKARDAGVRCAAVVGSSELTSARARRAGFDIVVEVRGRSIAEGAAELADRM